MEQLEVGPIFVGVVGGLALFLLGMDQLTAALKAAAGSGLKRILAALTGNRFKGVGAGAVVTAIIQSSSITTVLVVGFVSAGLMTMQQSIGVIMGANIGTTVTAQIVAFKVTKYALILIAAGFGTMFVFKDRRVAEYGAMVLGLGLIFYGMELMGSSTNPLRSYPPFLGAMSELDTAWIGVVAGALFTAIIQSSSATTGVVIVLAGQGLISIEAGIALALGANIGTCVTALLASAGKKREAIQAAMVHVVFNVAGVLIWIGLIDQLGELARLISPSEQGLTGVDRLAADTPRQVANAHTIFNVANTLILIWFVTPIAWLVNKIVPIRKDAKDLITPRYLDDILLDTPALALDRVRMELRRVSDRAASMVEDAMDVALDGTQRDIRELAKRDDQIDILYDEIIAYLSRLSRVELAANEVERTRSFIVAANSIEGIGDLIETNVAEAGYERIATGVVVSKGTAAALRRVHERVLFYTRLAFQALDAWDAGMGRMVQDGKPEVTGLIRQAEVTIAERLGAEARDRVAHYRVETDLIDYLRRVYQLARRIAKAIDGDDGAEPDPE